MPQGAEDCGAYAFGRRNLLVFAMAATDVMADEEVKEGITPMAVWRMVRSLIRILIPHAGAVLIHNAICSVCTA